MIDAYMRSAAERRSSGTPRADPAQDIPDWSDSGSEEIAMKKEDVYDDEAGSVVAPVVSAGDDAVPADSEAFAEPEPPTVFVPGELRTLQDSSELYRYCRDGFLFIQPALQPTVIAKASLTRDQILSCGATRGGRCRQRLPAPDPP